MNFIELNNLDVYIIIFLIFGLNLLIQFLLVKKVYLALCARFSGKEKSKTN